MRHRLDRLARQPQPLQHRGHHVGADLLVLVERVPAPVRPRRRRARLPHIVQQRREPQRHVPSRRRIERGEVVPVHVVRVPLVLIDPDPLGELRPDLRQYPRRPQESRSQPTARARSSACRSPRRPAPPTRSPRAALTPASPPPSARSARSRTAPRTGRRASCAADLPRMWPRRRCRSGPLECPRPRRTGRRSCRRRAAERSCSSESPAAAGRPRAESPALTRPRTPCARPRSTARAAAGRCPPRRLRAETSALRTTPRPRRPGRPASAPRAGGPAGCRSRRSRGLWGDGRFRRAWFGTRRGRDRRRHRSRRQVRQRSGWRRGGGVARAPHCTLVENHVLSAMLPMRQAAE